MHVLATLFNGNPNVGLYGYCAKAGVDNVCLLGEALSKEAEAELSNVLQASVHHVTIAGTPFPGLFLAGNEQALLVPSIAFDRELKALKELGLPVKAFDTKLTCLGNNLVANEHGCLASPNFTDGELKALEGDLGVPVKRIKIAGLETPGACIVVNGKKAIIHRDAAEDEIIMVRETLGLDEVTPASVSLGSPYVSAGILNDAHGFVISKTSGGPEIVHAEESLGYLEEKE